MIVNIVREAVNTGSPIATRYYNFADSEEAMVAPFRGIEKLETIARAAFYETNIFDTRVEQNMVTWKQGEGDAKLDESYVDRRLIKHLQVTVCTLCEHLMSVYTEEPTDIADAEVWALGQIPELYPNLQTLVVVLEHDPVQAPDTHYRPTGFAGFADSEWSVFVARQMEIALEKLIAAIRGLQFGSRLRSKHFTFTQDQEDESLCYVRAPNFDSRFGGPYFRVEACEGPVREAVAVDGRDRPVNVWEVMDLPKTIILL